MAPPSRHRVNHVSVIMTVSIAARIAVVLYAEISPKPVRLT